MKDVLFSLLVVLSVISSMMIVSLCVHSSVFDSNNEKFILYRNDWILSIFYRISLFFDKYIGVKNDKIIGYYIEHISLFYIVTLPTLAWLFKPSIVQNTSPDLELMTILLYFLILVNIICDCLSVKYTRKNIDLIICNPDKSTNFIFFIIIKDLFIAFILYILAQVTANFCHSYHIMDGGNWHEHIFSVNSTFMGYDYRFGSNYSYYKEIMIKFWLSCTTFIPTLILLLTIIILFFVNYTYYFSKKIAIQILNQDKIALDKGIIAIFSIILTDYGAYSYAYLAK